MLRLDHVHRGGIGKAATLGDVRRVLVHRRLVRSAVHRQGQRDPRAEHRHHRQADPHEQPARPDRVHHLLFDMAPIIVADGLRQRPRGSPGSESPPGSDHSRTRASPDPACVDGSAGRPHVIAEQRNAVLRERRDSLGRGHMVPMCASGPCCGTPNAETASGRPENLGAPSSQHVTQRSELRRQDPGC